MDDLHFQQVLILSDSTHLILSEYKVSATISYAGHQHVVMAVNCYKIIKNPMGLTLYQGVAYANWVLSPTL